VNNAKTQNFNSTGTDPCPSYKYYSSAAFNRELKNRTELRDLRLNQDFSEDEDSGRGSRPDTLVSKPF
jgi:hypothetical protein